MSTELLITLLTIAGGLVSLLTFFLGRMKSSKDAGKLEGVITAKLDAIMASVAGLTGDIDKLENRVSSLGERMAAVEASAKQAHHRLDSLTR